VGVGVSPRVGCHGIAEVLSSASPFKKRLGIPGIVYFHLHANMRGSPRVSRKSEYN
jgi:hypothetical protein